VADDCGSWAVGGILRNSGCDPDRRKSGGRVLDWWWGSNPGWSRCWRAGSRGGVGARAIRDRQSGRLSDRVGLSKKNQ
jgi:hypothetical protein